MAHFLFVDESGYDAGESPYGVLAGIAVEDRDLWSLVKDIRTTELNHFGGIQYSGGERELKAKKLLKRKAFASIVNKTSPPSSRDHLRKDYAYLFERFFYYLEDIGPSAYGIIVFDELEKIQSHLLVGQMDRYFKLTTRGRHRSSQILPEPLFVHSDLTTGVQLADLVAYTISWGVRFKGMDAPARTELGELAQRVMQLRHRSIREVNQTANFAVWSFVHIRDLRSREERDTDVAEELPQEDEGEN